MATDLIRAELTSLGRGAMVYKDTQKGHPLHGVEQDWNHDCFDVYREHSPEQFATQSLESWERFLSSPEQNQVYVFESYPFENALKVLLLLDADVEILNRYWRSVVDVLSETRPTLIYFEEDCIEEALLHAVKTRGPHWKRSIMESPYAQNRGLWETDCMLDMLSNYHRLCSAYVDDWPYALFTYEARPGIYSQREQGIKAVLKELYSN